MNKKIVFFLLLISFLFSSTALAALTQEDFTLYTIKDSSAPLAGVNLVSGGYKELIAKMGEPKKQTEDSGEQPVLYIIYPNLHLSLQSQTDKITYLRFDGKDYQTQRGIKVGGTAYKVIKEYGQPEKQLVKGHMYYIYTWDEKPAYRLVFDMSEGYVSRVIYTTLPTLP